jgi:hypothetical protein
MNEGCLENCFEPSNAGRVSINGEIAGRYDWHGYCVGRFEFCTNGPQGGGAGHGGFLRIAFTNSASTFMEVAVNGGEPKPVNSIAITFRGDAELDVARECLQFLTSKLNSIRELRSRGSCS